MTPLTFKNLCKLKVSEFWRSKLCVDVRSLALPYLNPNYLSLDKPHPIWTSIESGNPYEVKAAVIQATFFCGCYRSERLRRHWSITNPDGFCLMDSCSDLELHENIEHVLIHCFGLTDDRRWLEAFTYKYLAELPLIREIVLPYLFSSDYNIRCQFLIDCSVLPNVISKTQVFGQDVLFHCFKITRTWCHSLHLARLRNLGRR